METRAKFDGPGFVAALDAERRVRGFTWKQVAQDCGISASTLSRMSQGKHLDVNGLAALAAWSGLNLDRFVRSTVSKEAPEPLAAISSFLHSDPRLNEETALALGQIIKAAYLGITSQGAT